MPFTPEGEDGPWGFRGCAVGLTFRFREHTADMTLLVLAAVVAAWCLLPLPLAIAVGRAFRAGDPEDAPESAVTIADAGAAV